MILRRGLYKKTKFKIMKVKINDKKQYFFYLKKVYV